MVEVRSILYRRLVDFVLAHERRLKDEVSGEEMYSFTCQQLEEQFLSKLNILERAVAELARSEPREGQTTRTTFEAIEVIAKREELPQKVADVLAEHGQSEFLDLAVLRADEKHAEVLVVLAREESGRRAPAVPAEKKKHGQQGEDLSGGSET
jgi:protein-L-isoaspartate O-methyltransferase